MENQSSYASFRRALIFFTGFFGLAALLAGCAPEMRTFSPDVKNTLLPPRFGFFIINYPPVASDSSEGVLYARLRYDDVVFVKTDSGYRAHYQFSVNLFSDKELTTLMYSKIFDRQIQVPTYAETNSTSMFDTVRDEMTLKPGKYYVVLKLYDLNTNLTSTREFEHTFKDFLSDAVNISDVLVYARADTSGIPINRVRSGNGSILAKFYVTTKDVPAKISLHVIAKSVEVPTSIDTTFELTQSMNVVRYTLPVDISGLAPGVYDLRVSAKEDGKENSSRTTFEVMRNRIPQVPVELDQAIDPLVYIATPNEISSLKKGTFEERQKDFLDFWIARAHDNKEVAEAMRDEFYKRVDFANQHLGGGVEKGWRSDRGRIYIIYGPPDQIDSHGNNFNSPPYQIWYYYSLRLEFIFLDEFGTGDYKLVQQSQLN